MKKIAIVLLTFGLFTGIVSAADSDVKYVRTHKEVMGKEVVEMKFFSSAENNFEAAENSGLEEAASFSWRRVGQRVAVGVGGLLLSQAVVEKLGAEKSLGIAFGLSVAAVPAVWRETKIGFQELRVSGKRKELFATVVITTPLIVGLKAAGGLPILESDDLAKLSAAYVGQWFTIAALNNAVENRETYLEVLNTVISQKK